MNIELLEHTIKLNLDKIDFYNELKEIKDYLENKYNELQLNYRLDDSELRNKKYNASLISFLDYSINPILNLMKLKKNNKGLFDNSNVDIDEKLKAKIKEIETLIGYLKQEFDSIGNKLEHRLLNIKQEHHNNLNDAIDKIENDIKVQIGMRKTIQISLGNPDSIKKLI